MAEDRFGPDRAEAPRLLYLSLKTTVELLDPRQQAQPRRILEGGQRAAFDLAGIEQEIELPQRIARSVGFRRRWRQFGGFCRRRRAHVMPSDQ